MDPGVLGRVDGGCEVGEGRAFGEAVGYVVEDGSGEEEGGLRDEGDEGAEGCDVALFYWRAIER